MFVQLGHVALGYYSNAVGEQKSSIIRGVDFPAAEDYLHQAGAVRPLSGMLKVDIHR